MEELEKKLLLKFGNKRPFKVPENYFNDLEIRVMSQITTKATEINGDKQRDNRENYFTSARHLRPLIIAASFIGLIVVGVATQNIFQKHDQAKNIHDTDVASTATAAKDRSANTEYLDAAAEYMMIDKDDVYSYLADN